MRRPHSPCPAGRTRGKLRKHKEGRIDPMQLDAELELLRVTEACGALPITMVPRLEAQTGGQGTMQRALGAGYVSIGDVPTYQGGCIWYLTLTKRGRDRLRADPRSREWAPLDGWHRRCSPTDPPKSLTMHLMRAQAFVRVLLLIRAAGRSPWGWSPRTARSHWERPASIARASAAGSSGRTGRSCGK